MNIFEDRKQFFRFAQDDKNPKKNKK